MRIDGLGLFSDVCLLRSYQSRRSSSWDRTGGNTDSIVIAPGDRYCLLEESSAGCVKHFYWTYIEEEETRRLHLFRGNVLRAYWDGHDVPSIEVPLGDFFGVSNGQVRRINSLAFTTNPGGDRTGRASWGFNCYLPMPFSRGAHIEIENRSESDTRLWFHIDYETYEEASAIAQAAGRLHAHWNREDPTRAVAPSEGCDEMKNLSGAENYRILEVQGSGQLAGYFLTVVNRERDWWGEGDDMIFVDGEPFPPSIHGTGTEEVFGGGACPTQEYSGPYTGFHCIENRGGHNWWGTNGMYRFYVADPVRFHRSIDVTLEHGHGNDRANDYCSVAFWYHQGLREKMDAQPAPSARQVHFR